MTGVQRENESKTVHPLGRPLADKLWIVEFKKPWIYLADFNSAIANTPAACDENFETSDWRREGFLHPFCLLVIKAIRWDSHPPHLTGEPLKNALLDARIRLRLTRPQLAVKLNISRVTLSNWELGRTKPHRQLWKTLCRLNPFHDSIVEPRGKQVSYLNGVWRPH